MRLLVVAALLAGCAMQTVVAPDDTADAANCGGKRLCACGDKVVKDYVLPADLGPCSGNGLRIGAAVTFDGGGHVIRGRGPGTQGSGLRIPVEASGATIRDVRVTGFANGVRLVGARNVRLEGVEADGNGDPGPREGYGIDVSQAASDNVLERVKVHGNADEGIHVGTDASRNRIVDAQVWDNSRENVYFLACHDNRLERSKVWGSGRSNAAVYVKFATGTVIEGNSISGGPVQIRGGARGTTLADNTLSGAGVVLEAQDDKRFGSGTPSDTTVRGGSISAPDFCVRIAAASGTSVSDVKMSCPDGIKVARGSRVAVREAGGARVAVQCADGGTGCVQGQPPK
jgi:nitrous oxidase accessory protein NosD